MSLCNGTITSLRNGTITSLCNGTITSYFKVGLEFQHRPGDTEKDGETLSICRQKYQRTLPLEQ
jgi:hypothetical protein